MHSKYVVKEEDGIQFKSKYTSTQVWKGVLWGAGLLRKGPKWKVRNGRSMAFYRDKWLERKPLSELLLSSVSEEDTK